MIPRSNVVRGTAAGSILLLLAVVAFLLELALGRGGMPVNHVLPALVGDPVRSFETLILDLRLSRAVGAAFAGGGMAIAGALLQSATRNPLAEPGILGISGGAVLGVVLALWAGVRLPGGAPTTALIGAALAPVLIAAVLGRRWNSPRDLALTGVLVGLLLSAAASGVLVTSGQTLGVVLRWTIGSLNAVNWSDLTLMWPATVVGLVLIAIIIRPLGALALGDHVAVSIGARPTAVRAVALVAAVLLTCGAVTVGGALPFLGLAAPHIARRLVGSAPAILLPVSALMGTAILLCADLLAISISVDLRGIGTVTGLPVGAVIAPLAGPYLLVLLRNKTRLKGGIR
ncbi:iron ABC transporter permease [Microbacterium sp. JB110]|nr:iron ABC transporter permease [Microbacterium sp. JB110]SJM51630.1 Fe(3+) enterobactin transport system permease protein [Frigoribacterium sp. JB110]